jgi:hypothetical protein
MPGAFNADIVYRPPRTRGLSMLRPGTASAKHYLLPGPLSLAAFFAADATTLVVTETGAAADA